MKLTRYDMKTKRWNFTLHTSRPQLNTHSVLGHPYRQPKEKLCEVESRFIFCSIGLTLCSLNKISKTALSRNSYYNCTTEKMSSF